MGNQSPAGGLKFWLPLQWFFSGFSVTTVVPSFSPSLFYLPGKSLAEHVHWFLISARSFKVPKLWISPTHTKAEKEEKKKKNKNKINLTLAVHCLPTKCSKGGGNDRVCTRDDLVSLTAGCYDRNCGPVTSLEPPIHPPNYPSKTHVHIYHNYR